MRSSWCESQLTPSVAEGGGAVCIPLVQRAAKGEMIPVHQTEQPRGCCDLFFGDANCPHQDVVG